MSSSTAEKTYRLYDVGFRVRARWLSVIEHFDRTFGAFCSDGPVQLECLIETSQDGRGRVIINGSSTPIPMRDPGNEYAKWLVFAAIAAASRTHLFLHASSVLLNGKAVLLVGPTGHGKSTLAHALVQAGAQRHNEDVTPICVSSGHAERFPKDEPQTPGWPNLRVPVGAALFLNPGRASSHLRLAVDRLPADFTAACDTESAIKPDSCTSHKADPWLEGLSGVQIQVQRRQDYWEVSIAGHRASALRAFCEYCTSAGATILRELGTSQPRFATTPVLRPLAPHQAATWLMGNTFGRARRKAHDLIWETLSALEGARFWELAPGEPSATARTVLDAIGTATACA